MLALAPDLLGLVATVYGVAAAAAALLQARQMLARRSSCDVSARFFAIYAGGYAIWLLYGLSIASLPLVLVDAAGLVCGIVTSPSRFDCAALSSDRRRGRVAP